MGIPPYWATPTVLEKSCVYIHLVFVARSRISCIRVHFDLDFLLPSFVLGILYCVVIYLL